jgi:lysyl-tRNA synthetase class 2
MSIQHPEPESESAPRVTHPAPRFDVTLSAAAIVRSRDGKVGSLAGRVVLWRPMGGLVFGQVEDETGVVQVSVRRGDEPFDLAKTVALGDFIGVTGRVWTTSRGERTLGFDHLEILNRTQRSRPDKHAGIADPEIRRRQRYLDLMMNPDTRERFRVRSAAIMEMRRFLTEEGFMEVETPILQAASSGAAARPFVTHHHALDEDYFLRVSPETFLKRVMVGSFGRIFELGKSFRNEGMDSSHLQEFTMLEWYAAYWDYRDNMDLVQRFTRQVLLEAVGSLKVTFGGTELDFGAEWEEVDFRTAVLEATGVDLRQIRTLEALQADLADRGLGGADLKGAKSYAALVDGLYKRHVRPNLIQPTYLVHHPVELVPLARRSDEDPTQLEMFQLVVAGWEVVKAYSELVDLSDQRDRLEEQSRMRDAGDDETMMVEEDFLEAMAYGMPPMSGVGFGIDRFLALVTDQVSIRDVVLFPTVARMEAPGGA